MAAATHHLGVTTFNEADHPRAAGRFAPKTHAEADLGDTLTVPAEGHQAIVVARPGVTYDVTVMHKGEERTDRMVAGVQTDPDTWLTAEDGSTWRRSTIVRFRRASETSLQQLRELQAEATRVRDEARDLLVAEIKSHLGTAFAEVRSIDFELDPEGEYPTDLTVSGVGHDGEDKRAFYAPFPETAVGRDVERAIYNLPTECWPSDPVDGRYYTLHMDDGRITEDLER